MAQHDYSIANQTFPATRSDINDALSAILSLNSGTTAPSTTAAGMLWYDTTNGLIKQRNAANSAWVTVFTVGKQGLIPQDGSTIYAADAEASDTYVITLTPAPSALVDGQVINFKANTANTGAATLNVNSLGAKDIRKNYDTALDTNDIEAGQIVTVAYDSDNDWFQLLSPISNVSTVSAASQAEQESASSTTVYVTPGRQHYHPSALKAWAYIDFSLATPAIIAGYNVTSVSDIGTGKGVLTLTTGLSSGTAGAVQVVASRGTPHTNLADFSEGYLSSATQVTFGIYDGAGYYDAPYVYIFVVGDMA